MKPKKEGNKYDKIIKENLEALFLPFLEQLLGIRIMSAERLPAKMQTTQEREADFLRKITNEEGKESILHLEFESEAKRIMVYRVSEYHGILLKKHRLPIYHVVVYLGKRRPNIPTQLKKEEVYTGFELIDLGRLDYKQMLSSQIPEAVVLAILADFKGEPPEKAIRSILERLRQVAKGELSLQKYIRQLNVLSGLRKLHELTVKTIEDMPITYDIRTDFLYKKGKVEGKVEGKAEGKIEGMEHKARIVVARGHERGLSPEEIAELADMPVEWVKAVIREIEAEGKAKD